MSIKNQLIKWQQNLNTPGWSQKDIVRHTITAAGSSFYFGDVMVKYSTIPGLSKSVSQGTRVGNYVFEFFPDNKMIDDEKFAVTFINELAKHKIKVARSTTEDSIRKRMLSFGSGLYDNKNKYSKYDFEIYPFFKDYIVKFEKLLYVILKRFWDNLIKELNFNTGEERYKRLEFYSAIYNNIESQLSIEFNFFNERFNSVSSRKEKNKVFDLIKKLGDNKTLHYFSIIKNLRGYITFQELLLEKKNEFAGKRFSNNNPVKKIIIEYIAYEASFDHHKDLKKSYKKIPKILKAIENDNRFREIYRNADLEGWLPKKIDTWIKRKSNNDEYRQIYKEITIEKIGECKNQLIKVFGNNVLFNPWNEKLREKYLKEFGGNEALVEFIRKDIIS